MRFPLRRYRALLARYLAPQSPRVALLAALVAGTTVLQSLAPQVVRGFIDATQSGAPPVQLTLAAALYLGISLAQRAATVGAANVGMNVSLTATNALRADVLRHCLDLDLPFHKRHTPGELIERIAGDVVALGNFFSQFTIRVAGNALLILGVLALVFREDARLGVGLAAYVLLTFAALGAFQSLAVAHWAASRQASAEQYAFLEERISDTEDIRANGGEGYVLDGFSRRADTLLRAERRAQLTSQLATVATNTLFALGFALALGFGASLYVQGTVTIGTVFLLATYARMIFEPLENIREQAQSLQQATAAIGRVDALLRLQQGVRDAPAAARVVLPSEPLAVEFDRVSFRYDEAEGDAESTAESEPAPGVLHDVSFRLAPGRILGVLGRTGSGKTTLARLLFRLYDPTAGAVRLGGADLRQVPLATLRERIGIVTQDVQLFRATIRENLTFFGRGVADERIVAVLGELGLDAWMRALPHGLDTDLAAGGQTLSAGEAQLLALARVYLRDPAVVVLDEASSRLDPATERMLERALDRLLADRTGIVIAHRLATVRRADEILLLEGGRIAEHGPRAALEADPHSRFAALLRTGLETDLDSAAAALSPAGFAR